MPSHVTCSTGAIEDVSQGKGKAPGCWDGKPLNVHLADSAADKYAAEVMMMMMALTLYNEQINMTPLDP